MAAPPGYRPIAFADIQVGQEIKAIGIGNPNISFKGVVNTILPGPRLELTITETAPTGPIGSIRNFFAVGFNFYESIAKGRKAAIEPVYRGLKRAWEHFPGRNTMKPGSKGVRNTTGIIGQFLGNTYTKPSWTPKANANANANANAEGGKRSKRRRGTKKSKKSRKGKSRKH
jgi:hypothetical protein